MFDSEKARLAGQKSKRGPDEKKRIINQIIDDTMSFEDKLSLWKTILDKAKSGDFKFAQLAAHYVFGKPTENINLEGEIVAKMTGFNMINPDEQSNDKTNP